MKKLSILCLSALVFLFIGASCMHRDNGHISITLNDSDDEYYMTAEFSRSRTRQIDEYMDEKIGRRSHMSFVNSRIDGTISLDDHTTFYVKKYPGLLEIKLDKKRNSNDSYHQVKSMCEGIKQLLANNDRR